MPIVGRGPRVDVGPVSLSEAGLLAAWSVFAKATIGVQLAPGKWVAAVIILVAQGYLLLGPSGAAEEPVAAGPQIVAEARDAA